jgi:hypothetical protein
MASPVRTALLKLVREVQFLPPLRRHFFPRLDYNVTPPELCYLCACLDRTRDVPGSVVEVGCSRGHTTVFLAKYLAAQGIDRRYVAVDTFNGFLPADVDHEVVDRGKDRALLDGAFRVNSKRWFDGTMAMNGIRSVESIRADAASVDYASLGPIAFAFLDVDLYRPVSLTIRPLYAALALGGVLAIHDCARTANSADDRHDGAELAYREFCAELGIAPTIGCNSIGIIERTTERA